MNPYHPQKFLNLKQPIIVALSGGADSVCLTDYLCCLEKYEIILAHFNHHIREKESDRDEEFVKQLAQKLKLPIEVGHWEKPEKSEAAARESRYDFLRKTQMKYKAQAICLGHHLDDQVETILFNLIRGTGLKGLQGMSVYANELLRPLLRCDKSEILNYCKKKKLAFVNDATNDDIDYARNRLRKNVIPELKKINPNLSRTLMQNALTLSEIHANLENQVLPLLKKECLELKEFCELDIAIQRELIKQKIKTHTEVSSKKIEEILCVVRRGHGNKYKQFDNIRITIHKGKIFFNEIPPRKKDDHQRL